MEKRELTCIGCPMGCLVTVVTEGRDIAEITGYTCPRGKVYAEKEVRDPARIVTSTVRVEEGESPVVSVKTKTEIPKGKITDCMRAINGITVKAPIEIGDILLADAAGTGVPVVATKRVKEVRCDGGEDRKRSPDRPGQRRSELTGNCD